MLSFAHPPLFKMKYAVIGDGIVVDKDFVSWTDE